MLPLYVSFYFLAFQTLEVPNNWYTNNIHAIISARSLAENASIDDIRIPRRPWDERLHSMIARLKRELFGKNTNKHWLVAAESLQNDRNQQKNSKI